MTQPNDTVFLVDVDNTLLNNDLFQHELKRYIEERLGSVAKDCYWSIQDKLFQGGGYRDYLGAFQQLREEYGEEPEVLWLAGFVLDFPYEKLLFPGSLDVLIQLRALGRTVLLTDGDAVFQPLKLRRSGLEEAIGRDKVMISFHKESSLLEVERRFPAERYVMIDDKLKLLTAVKRVWGDRVMTVFPKQGQFAFNTTVLAENPPPDLEVPQIGDLLDTVTLGRLAGIAAP